jgi:hypothetical protein
VAANSSPVASSTKKYRQLIGSPQYRHLRPKHKKAEERH